MLRVFLTDDDEDDRLFFQESIESIDIETELVVFKNGDELMRYLNSENAKLPHLIFLDLNMPIKNGLECLKEIKASDQLKDLLIAIYSTSSSEKDIETTFINGANIYINKPDNFNSLKSSIEKVLKINWQYHTSNLNRETFLFRI
ncbi:MAG: response regulator [Algicola sp.]|nr:response regulator [Algicola sp.]